MAEYDCPNCGNEVKVVKDKERSKWHTNEFKFVCPVCDWEKEKR